MRAPEFDDGVLRENLEYVDVAEVRDAARVLIEHAVRLGRAECSPAIQGAIRTFRYFANGHVPFAFIFNKASLLFYLRRPALSERSVPACLSALKKTGHFELRTNPAGEVTLRVSLKSQAHLLNQLLIDPALDAEGPRDIEPHHNREYTKMSEPIRRPAALVRQGQLRLYTTSLQARHLLVPGFYDIERLDPSDTHDKGYQRVLNTARAKRLADYLVAGQATHDAFLPTSIFLATDKELNFDEHKNELEIDLTKVGSFSVVDGQHRLEGLRLAAEKNPELRLFEVPVNIGVGLSKIAQMCHFLIVNTTQKSVDKAVEQRLIARLTDMVDLEDVPTLPKWIRRVVESGDDSVALSLIDYLNRVPDSPWKGKIEIPNTVAGETTVTQKSFAVAIKKYVLAGSNPLAVRTLEQQQRIFLNYWRAIADELGTDEETVLFKSIGVDLFCRFSSTVFGKLQNTGNFSVPTIRALLRRTFDHMEGDYVGLGQADWWLSGSGPAGGLNASALGKINQELAKALHRADDGEVLVL